MNSVRIPSLVLKSIERGRCILFVGAGVSYEAGLPTSSKLATMLADDVGYPNTFPHDLIDISQYYEAKLGRAVLINRLQEILQKPTQPSETHKLIAALGRKFRLIITTNYDSLLENALADIGYPFYIVTEAADLANAPVETEIPTLIKIHGDIDANNIILTRDDYYRYLDKSFRSTLGAVLKAQLATGTFLFVGYSLRDYNFVALFESVRKELGDYMPKGFAVMPSPDPVETRIWLKRGVDIIDSTARAFFKQISRSLAASGPAQVFLSYSFQDKDWAERIRLELEAKGIKTFSPARDIHMGDNLAERITEGIVQSQAFIVLLSPESVRSEAIIRELRIALSLRRGRIFPILLKDCEVPEIIKHLKYSEVREDLSSAIEELVLTTAGRVTLSISEKVKEFDKSGEYRRDVDVALRLLKRFRQKYPFRDNPRYIDNLTADDLFKEKPPQIGDFFRWIEYKLKPLGHLSVYSSVYRNARNQLEDFKALLRVVVNENKSLAEKVDAPWQRISRMGGDKHIAKKIIFCFNDGVLPIFKTADLEHFFVQLVGKHKLPSSYDTMSLGEKYQFLTRGLLNVKKRFAETREWNNAYFMWFLYKMYSPPREF